MKKVFNTYPKRSELMTFEAKETIKCPICDKLFTTEVSFLLKEVGEGLWAWEGPSVCPHCNASGIIHKKMYIPK